MDQPKFQTDLVAEANHRVANSLALLGGLVRMQARAIGKTSQSYSNAEIRLLFDGIAYGMLLFILAVGLSVTMGLMNFINLAHGAFAMVGGYITVVLMQRWGVPFLLCLPLFICLFFFFFRCHLLISF